MAGGIEWWACAEVSEPDVLDASTRDRRLSRAPDAVFHEPVQVADWIEGMTRRHASRHEVHLIGGGGTAETGDERHRQRDFDENLAVLHRGDSLYIDFHHGTGRTHLRVEAVHNGTGGAR